MDVSFQEQAPSAQQMPVQKRKEERAKQRAQEKKEMEKKPTAEVLQLMNNRQLYVQVIESRSMFYSDSIVKERGVAELARRVLSPASPHHCIHLFVLIYH